MVGFNFVSPQFVCMWEWAPYTQRIYTEMWNHLIYIVLQNIFIFIDIDIYIVLQQ